MNRFFDALAQTLLVVAAVMMLGLLCYVAIVQPIVIVAYVFFVTVFAYFYFRPQEY